MIAESATLKAGKYALIPVKVDEIDDISEPNAVDHVAERPAEHQRRPAASKAVDARACASSQTMMRDADRRPRAR